MLAAMMVVATCCGMQVWHFCSGCSRTAQHNCCDDCVGCGEQTCHHCWYFHADSSPSVQSSVQALPAPHETVALINMLSAQEIECLTAADEEILCYSDAPPLLCQQGRFLILQTAKLTL